VSQDSLPYRYLAVDGPIGAGKTTLVEMLSQHFEGTKVLEDVENPFLDDFYKERQGAAFQTQLYFLLSRFRQQQDLIQPGLFQKLMVADYTFQKDRIFAYLNLDDAELLLYDKLYALLEPQIPTPDLVIYLVADRDACRSRIKKGTRVKERRISDSYLAELIDAYHHYYHYYSGSPLLVVDRRHMDFLERPDDFEELVHRLKQPVKGTQYFVPLGSR
jgi:deoxyguanosine kinase